MDRHPEAIPVLHSNRTSHPLVSRWMVATNGYWVMKTFCVDGVGVALLLSESVSDMASFNSYVAAPPRENQP